MVYFCLIEARLSHFLTLYEFIVVLVESVITRMDRPRAHWLYYANISAMQHIGIFDTTALRLFLHTLSIWMGGMDEEFKEMYTQTLEEKCLKVLVYSSPPTPF